MCVTIGNTLCAAAAAAAAGAAYMRLTNSVIVLAAAAVPLLHCQFLLPNAVYSQCVPYATAYKH
jgi:hypothetical protein